MTSTDGGSGAGGVPYVSPDELHRLTESAERYRLLASHASDVVYRVGRDRRFEWILPPVDGVLGWTAEELLGTTPSDLVHPDDLDAALEQRRRIEAREVPGTMPGAVLVRIRTKAGGYRWMSARITALTDDQGYAGAVVGLQDVDELVRSRDETRRLLALVEALFTRGAVLGVELENDGTVVWVSTSVEAMLGYDAAEVVGRSAPSWVHPDDLDRLDALLSSLDAAQSSSPVEFRLRAASGEYRYFAGSAERSLGAITEPDHFDLILSDVTDKRAAEQMREQLVAVARQDLRDPLAFVFGSLQLLEEGTVTSTDDRGRALVAKMRASTHRLVNMVESLLRLE